MKRFLLASLCILISAAVAWSNPPAPTRPLTVLLLQSGRSVTLAWDDDANAAGSVHYWVYHSMTSGIFTVSDRRDAGQLKTLTWADLPYGRSYFVVSAATLNEPVLESIYSNEVNTLVPVPTLTLTCPSVTTGTVGAIFNTTLLAVGGVPPYTFGTSSGQLPPGLILSPTTGTISGTPTFAGTYSFAAYVTDSMASPPGNCNCTLTIKPATPTSLQITSGPIATMLDRRRYEIRWSTSIPADSTVMYWRRSNATRTLHDEALVMSHAMLVPDVQPNQMWIYRIKSTGDGQTVEATGTFISRRLP